MKTSWTLAVLTASMVGCHPPAPRSERPFAEVVVPPDEEEDRLDADDLDLTEPIRLMRAGREHFEPVSIPNRVEPFELTTRVVATATIGEQIVRDSRIVTRATDRIHVECPGSEQEWLFVRNAVDGSRVTAYLLDHEQQLVLVYQETDLRIEGIVRGWADVLALGFPIELLDAARRTEDTTQLLGVSFSRYVAAMTPPASASTSLEVWWSERLHLPARVEWGTRERHTVVELVGTSEGLDRARLEDPSRRFPGYQVMDLVDWREEHDPHRGGGVTPTPPWFM